jgi:hypothetical protein
LRIEAVVTEYFGYGNLEVPGGRKAWKMAGMGEAFLHYAQLVARQDNNAGGWEVVMREKARRVYLVMGVLTRVLQTEVFDEYLFGVDKKTREMLKAQDKLTVASEGE